MEEVVVTLDRPIKIKVGDNEEELKEIKLRAPKGRDLRQTDKAKGDIERAVMLASLISGRPVAVFDELHASDFMKVMKATEAFLS